MVLTEAYDFQLQVRTLKVWRKGNWKRKQLVQFLKNALNCPDLNSVGFAYEVHEGNMR